jgi:hypothetical protein
MSRDISVGIATKPRAGRSEFDSRQGLGNFLLETTSRPALEPTQWVLESLSRGVKLTTYLHLVPWSKNASNYTSTPQYVSMAWCLVKHRDNFFTYIHGKKEPWLSLGVKRPGREADHSPPSGAEVKDLVELYLHYPNIPPWRGAQSKHRDKFTFTFYSFGLHKITGLFLFCVWYIIHCF